MLHAQQYLLILKWEHVPVLVISSQHFCVIINQIHLQIHSKLCVHDSLKRWIIPHNKYKQKVSTTQSQQYASVWRLNCIWNWNKKTGLTNDLGIGLHKGAPFGYLFESCQNKSNEKDLPLHVEWFIPQNVSHLNMSVMYLNMCALYILFLLYLNIIIK